MYVFILPVRALTQATFQANAYNNVHASGIKYRKQRTKKSTYKLFIIYRNQNRIITHPSSF